MGRAVLSFVVVTLKSDQPLYRRIKLEGSVTYIVVFRLLGSSYWLDVQDPDIGDQWAKLNLLSIYVMIKAKFFSIFRLRNLKD